MSWVLGLDRSTSAASKTSGQGKMTFKVLYTSSRLPSEAQVPDVLKAAHGGFAVDRRTGKGETYFALPGAGIIQINSDLKSTRMISTPLSMKETNMHKATIWYSDGGAYLTFPGNQSAQVVTTTLDGKLVNTLKTPEPGTDLGHPHASDYFAGAGNFVPTDPEYLDGTIYVATGYSKLDYVLTAKVLSTNPFKAEWHDLSFGGKGTGVGQFGTGHGITVPGGTRRVEVADRLYSEIDRFTRTGQYISTVMIKEDLGLENFTHIHNAVPRKHGGKYYVTAQAWNPGDFAILEQVN